MTRSATQPAHCGAAGEIGWLMREQSAEITASLDYSAHFRALLATLPPAHEVLTPEALAELPIAPQGIGAAAGRRDERSTAQDEATSDEVVERWRSLSYLLVPGLLTKWYPLYMAQARHVLSARSMRSCIYRVHAIRCRQSAARKSASSQTTWLLHACLACACQHCRVLIRYAPCPPTSCCSCAPISNDSASTPHSRP